MCGTFTKITPPLNVPTGKIVEASIRIVDENGKTFVCEMQDLQQWSLCTKVGAFEIPSGDGEFTACKSDGSVFVTVSLVGRRESSAVVTE